MKENAVLIIVGILVFPLAVVWLGSTYLVSQIANLIYGKETFKHELD
jgi:hypothetical protein